MTGVPSMSPWGRVQQLLQLLKPPPSDPIRQAERIRSVERDIMLPVKAVFIVILAYYLFFSPWMHNVAIMRDVALEFIQKFFIAYAASNLVVAYTLLAMKRFSLPAVQWVLFISGLLDGLLLAALTLLTNGFESILYWFFPALIVRNAISLPLASQQITLNFAVSFCYLLAGLLHVAMTESELASAQRDSLQFKHLTTLTNALLSPGGDPNVRSSLDMGTVELPTEPFLLRLMVLFLMTFVCYGLQILFEKQRLADEEAREFALRQEQLNSAGRLSAEIAHQIKNPLGIINNAAYNLQRLVPLDKEVARAQIEIIREEVERADRIITDLLGYAKLAEVRVEKLDAAEELDRAIEKVFPKNAEFAVEIRRHYQANLPPLMMQRGHLAEIFVNILQNAREALHGPGKVEVTTAVNPQEEVLVTIADNGPGIATERLGQIFEAYYTTKSKGTGLGLAIVRHSLDIYGGRVSVESELGKGARFILTFPAKALQRVPK